MLDTPFSASPDAIRNAARLLYSQLLRPADAVLVNAQRLLFIPDGPLHELPFAALCRGDQYLVQWKPLHSALSATIYAELKRTRGETTNYKFNLLAFGDPSYPPADARMAASQNTQLRDAAEHGFTFAPLKNSRSEVNAVAKVVGDHTAKFLGDDATEENAKSLPSSARFLHFATHGFFDSKMPLNSALVLSIPSGASDTRENGLLQAWELLNGVRWNVDLAVMSGCQTALGREFSGEGMIGLTRAVQYAGARSTIASLWSIDDSVTPGFMLDLYRSLAGGQTKDEALRTAQRNMIANNFHPFYWAAFTLNGDWQ